MNMAAVGFAPGTAKSDGLCVFNGGQSREMTQLTSFYNWVRPGGTPDPGAPKIV
jgi:hypothetical protein